MADVPITAHHLLDLLTKRDREIAILDLRTPLDRSNGHIAISAGLPFHDLEQHITALVPRPDTLIVLAGRPEVDERGAELLKRLGYRNVEVLENGIDGWKSAGGRIYTGTNVRSKTLGEWIERKYATPTIDSDTLQQWRQAGEDVIVLDSRPATEYLHHHIPGGYNTGGGAEIAYRGTQLVNNPQTKVVVNCAGRTRGIVGAQSLINTGIPNPVFSLHNGTPAWEKSGRALAFGAESDIPAPESVTPQLAQWAADTLAKAGAEVLTVAEVAQHLDDTTATTYLLDVRTPGEFAEQHFAAAVSAPGGQLVQGTDEFIAVRGARVVLVDTPDFVRAANTAQWLQFLHDGPLAVVAYTPDEDVLPANRFQIPLPDVARISWSDVQQQSVRLVDLRDSTRYDAGHLPGSIHARREHLDDLIADADGARVVLVGDADFTAEHVAATLPSAVSVLEGGIEAAADALTTEDPEYAGAIVDRTGPPDFGPERASWYEAYFAWELSLLRDSVGDPFLDFDSVDDR